MPQTQTVETVPLYRIENPNILGRHDGKTSHQGLVGQWFSPRLDYVLPYLRKSTQTFGKPEDIRPVDGAQLLIAHVPRARLSEFDAFEHPIAKGMDIEGENYIVPRDGSVEVDTIPLDETIGDLRGHLGRVAVRREASERIHDLLGRIATER